MTQITSWFGLVPRYMWELFGVVLDTVLVIAGFVDLMSYLETARRTEECKHVYYKSVLESALTACQEVHAADGDTNSCDWRPELRNREVDAYNKMQDSSSIQERGVRWLWVVVVASILVALVQIPESLGFWSILAYVVRFLLIPLEFVIIANSTGRARKRLKERMESIWRLKV